MEHTGLKVSNLYISQIKRKCGLEVGKNYFDGSMIAIDTIAVENEVADDMYQRSELDYLVYNAPWEYADLILNGDPKTYLRTVTVI